MPQEQPPLMRPKCRLRRPNVLITGTPGTGKTTLAAMIVERLNSRTTNVKQEEEEDDNNEDINIAKHINIGEIIRTYQFYDGYDTELETHILDEDQLIDYLDEVFIETLTSKTQVEATSSLECNDENHENYSVSLITDYHICEIFPERYFDVVLVLRTNTELLYDRYMERNYIHHHTSSSSSTTNNSNNNNDTNNTPVVVSAKVTQNLQCEIMNVIFENARNSYASEIVIELPSNTIADMESNVERVLQWIQLWMKQNES